MPVAASALMRNSAGPSGVLMFHQPGSSPGSAARTLMIAHRGQFAASARKAWTSPAGRSIVTDFVTERAGGASIYLTPGDLGREVPASCASRYGPRSQLDSEEH